MKKLKSIPTSKIARAGKFASAGLKVGANYVKHYGKKNFSKNYDSNELNRNNAEDIYNCLSELKGSALKVAQMLSLDKSTLPEAYSDKFAMAQYQAPPISAPLIRKLVKKRLGDLPENIFDEFSKDAVRAASIGQVHKAKYKGKDVAVKIQYPGVADSISSDLKLVKPFALKLLKLKKSEVSVYFKEVEKKMLEETDYIQEMNQADFIADNCKNVPNLKFAKYFKKICTDKILCMDWLPGLQLDEYFSEEIDQEIRNRIGQTLWDFYFHQMHVLKFLHADPHPGNFLISDDYTVNVIDFGCMKKVPKGFYHEYFASADKSLFEKEKKFRKNLLNLEIIRNDDNEEAQQFFSKSFKKLMKLAMAPFYVKTFDFADPQFFLDLRDTGETINKEQTKRGYSHSRGSKHFIYTNRTYYGLYNILHLLKADISTGPLTMKRRTT